MTTRTPPWKKYIDRVYLVDSTVYVQLKPEYQITNDKDDKIRATLRRHPMLAELARVKTGVTDINLRASHTGSQHAIVEFQ
jgi:hypothetical protein